MNAHTLLRDKPLLLVTAIVIIAAVYWIAFAFNAYGTFHEYDDLGIFAHNMWLDIHYPSISHGLQYLVFGNHIAPDMLLLLPFFYLYQSSLTLLVLQVLALSLTSIVVFMVARDFLKSNWLGFAVFAAFVINPGMHGMLIYDFHAENLIILFYILAFYFYTKLQKIPFFVSALLLLGTIEEAPLLGIAFGIGLLLFEFVHRRADAEFRQRIMLAGSMVLLSVAVLGAYIGITLSLQHAYAAGQYATLPPYLQVGNQLTSAVGMSPSIHSASSIAIWNSYTVYGLAVGFLFLGIAVFLAPLTALIMSSPWLFEVFVSNNMSFVTMFSQYFGFLLGSTLVAGMLGIKMLQNRKDWTHMFLANSIKEGTTLRISYNTLVASIIIVNVIILLLYPMFVLSRNVNNIYQDFFFQVSSTQRIYYQQLNSIMALIPNAASLAAPYFTTPQLMGREYLEDMGYTMVKWYFPPQYILVNLNTNVSLNALASENQLANYLRYNQSNYTIYAQNGTTLLLKHT